MEVNVTVIHGVTYVSEKTFTVGEWKELVQDRAIKFNDIHLIHTLKGVLEALKGHYKVIESISGHNVIVE